MIKKASLLMIALFVASSMFVSVVRAEGGESHNRPMMPRPPAWLEDGNGLSGPEDENEDNASSSRPGMHGPHASSSNWGHEREGDHHGSTTGDREDWMHNGSSTRDRGNWMHTGSSTGDMPPTQGIVSNLQSMTQDQMQSLLALLMKLIALLQQR